MTAGHFGKDTATAGQLQWAGLLTGSSEAQGSVHLVGIGGAGLSAIARLLLARGIPVSGSDLRASATTQELAELGALIFLGHEARHVAEAGLVLISSAVPSSNPEVTAALEAGIPVVKRAQFLAPLMAGHVSICVAGTHGKTTVSAMLATLLDAAGAEPSFIVGSEILALGTNARQGRPGGPFVIEADEYDHTFLGLRPRIAVVTSVEWDHVDCYPKAQDYREAFLAFVRLVSRDGTIVYCSDDQGARDLRAAGSSVGARWLSYGLGQGAAWRARDLVRNLAGGSDFLLERDGRTVGHVSLPLAGEHNVRNVLAALAAAQAAGYVFTDQDENLKIWPKLTGTARRLERKGESCGIIVLDDYAHHPTEVRATLSAVRQRFPRRAVWALFQPHTYSRTRALLHDFCDSFENADHVLVTDIYAAREHDTMGVSSSDLVDALEAHADARYVGDLDSALDSLLSELAPGDVLITLGAGDGHLVGERVLAALRPAQSQPELSLEQRQELLAEAIERELLLPLKRQEQLAAHTTMRVGGPADLLVVVTRVEDLVALAGMAGRWQVPWTLLGGGSNVVVSDQGMRGLVMVDACRAIRLHEGHVVWAEAGAKLAGLARQTLRWGLSGLEWGVSVPGTVGGAVVGNAGAHGGSIADNLVRATLLQPDGSLAEWPAARFGYGYRSSVLKAKLRRGEPAPIVLSAAFQLEPAHSAEAEQRAAEFLAQRRSTQPMEPSAGSIFQNPPGDFAGRILDSLGFKGRASGGAAFSEVHANFIVNHGGATAGDVLGLINEARKAVWQAMGIALEPEVLFLGDWPEGPPVAALETPVGRRLDDRR